MSNWARRRPLLGHPWPVQVFAVDDCSAQLTWKAAPAEGLRLEVGDAVVEPVPSPRTELALAPARPGAKRGTRRLVDPAWASGPGSAVFESLAPAATYDVFASARGVPRFVAARLVTLPRPEGALVAKFATVSDIHVGEAHFGMTGRILDIGRLSGTEEPYPVRCMRAAMTEIALWGAKLLVVKGDLTRRASATEVRDAGRLLTASAVPVVAVLGNHDNQLGVSARAILESQGLCLPWGPQVVDLPGLRIVLVGTSHGNPHYHRGTLPPELGRRVVELAAGTGAPAWIGMHHPPELHRYPTVYPPGIPFAESLAFLDELAGAKPGALVSCGHRHRNRRYRHGPVVISEVGSTKDYPGVWAGYRVFEGGIIQTVRRISRPDVMAWTESTRRAMNGQWGRWSPGRLEDRCFALDSSPR